MNLSKIFTSPRIYDRIAAFLFGLITALIIGYLKDKIGAGNIWLVIVIILTAIACVFLARALRKPSIEVIIKNPQTITSDVEAKQYARKVFIGFVPLFNGGRNLSEDDKKEAIANCDFDKFDIASSNFQPTIKAILAHKSKLKHCWLISTDTSLQYAEFLVRYLKQEEKIRCRFYFGDSYMISIDEDSQIINKTYDIVRNVFNEIPKNTKSSEIITDITTGIRSMSLGMILACLDKERDIEFIGTRYDKNGRIDFSYHKPIIFSFDPQLKEQN